MLPCPHGANGSCHRSVSVMSTAMDARCYRTKFVGPLCLTPLTAYRQLLMTTPTSHMVQLLPSARWTKTPHPPVFDKCRLLGFAVKLQKALSKEFPFPVISSRRLEDAGQTRHGLLLETDLVFPGDTGLAHLPASSGWKSCELWKDSVLLAMTSTERARLRTRSAASPR